MITPQQFEIDVAFESSELDFSLALESVCLLIVDFPNWSRVRTAVLRYSQDVEIWFLNALIRMLA